MNRLFEQRPLTLVIESLQDDNATVVRLIDHRGNYSTGSSKRIAGDQRDYPIGLDLAIARAMIKHGKEILKRHGAK